MHSNDPDRLRRDEGPNALTKAAEGESDMILGVLIELSDNPSRRVGNPEIEDFSGFHESIKRMSKFFNRCRIIPTITRLSRSGCPTTSEHITNRCNPSAISSNYPRGRRGGFLPNCQCNSHELGGLPNSTCTVT
jgi:hypothetical protein